MKRHIIVGAIMVLISGPHQVSGQTVDWFTGGNTSLNPTTSFLGTSDGVPINFRTNNTLRMKLNNTVSYTIGSFATQVKDGALGLSPNGTLWSSGPGPFSRLHLHDGTAAVLTASYRSWMDNGITFTTNSDQMYVGHKVEDGSDQTAAVIQWGDNEGAGAGPDVMKFLFTSNYTGGSGPNGMSGREIARMHPSGYLGVGDWQATAFQPDERLDLLDRTMRLRSFVHPTLYRNDTYDRVLVANPTDGRVYWRPASTIGGSGGCEWTLQGAPGSNSNIATAYTSNPGCPQMDRGVGIGTATPSAKLHVLHSNYTQLSSGRRAIWSSIVADDFINKFQGVYGESGPIAVDGFVGDVEGVHGRGLNGKTTIGVKGHGLFNSTSGGAGTGFLAGVMGVGECIQTYHSSFTTGIYGTHTTPVGTPNVWAGYFVGRVNATAFVVGPSDAGLKTGIEPLNDALSTIMALQPQRYSFRTEEFPQMNLPEGTRMGLISQQVQEVLPNLVVPAQHPAQYDSSGSVTHPAVDYLAMNYTELIPLLIAGMQEQNARIDQLEQQLAACCAAGDGEFRSTPAEEGSAASSMNERQLRIQPNPFNEATTVSYKLEKGGRMQLMANSADGKQLQVLEEAQRESGDYRFEWNTAGLAPGVYYVTLMLDGQPLVKKAVKVTR